LNSRGVVLGALGRHQEALASFDSTLALESNYVVALSNRGNCLNELGRYEEALHSANRAIGVNPNHPEAYIPRAAAQRECKRYAEALESYGQAIKFNPNFTTAWVGLGNVFCDLKRHDEALAAHDKALALDPNLANAWLGRGNVFSDVRRYDEAFAAYDKALALKADLPEAWLGRGNVFTNLKRYDEALAAYDKVITLESDFSEAWLGRGNVFANLRRYDEAFAAYDRAFALEPDLEGAEGARLHAKMHCCDWKEFRAECDHLLSSIRNGKVNTEPFAMLAIPSSPDDQLRCSKLWVAERNPPVGKPIWQGERYNHSRTRVAYLSADFYQHATSYLAAGMFECHDKSRFDVTAISIGPNNASEMRKRLEAAFERFVDAENYSDERVADQIRDSEIDILIDLKGFTADSRTGILARRAAPVQVNYLGYPGTMGAPFIDYIVADRVLIPETQREFYSEKVVVLPNSYQVNDRARPVSDRSFTRRECGLPDTGFVFCCFNGAYKITPSIFDSWMRILKQVEGSVLWLLGDSANVMSNLREEAAARGVTGERLVFASRMSLPEHLARHRLADLFLDTLPYNAHTTASDALWAGLPVLTCAGETFASRVAASLLCATGLPELITTTPEVYEQMAVELAVRPGHVADIKRKLSENRLSTPLFDTARFTRHIEAAYAAMHDRHQAGLAPDHINVPDL
jgi:predicted O-linked N-acetylglucosamine transferase (SPINDLY family)